MLVNNLNDVFSKWWNKLYVCGSSFFSALCIFVLVATALSAEPAGEVSRSHEVVGFALFIIIGFAFVAFSSDSLRLKMHEEDILLCIPTGLPSIAQSRFIRVLVITPMVALFASSTALSLQYVLVRTDYLARLPYAFGSIFLFSLASMGVFWTLAGVMSKHPRFARLLEYTVAAILIAIAILIVIIAQQGQEALLEAWDQTYNHQAIRVLLVVPLSAADVFLFGELSAKTIVEIVGLAGIAIASLILAFRYGYELCEKDISPLYGTVGRGIERESPPLPRMLEAIRNALHVECSDMGTESRAIFGYAYSRSLRFSFGLGLLSAVGLVSLAIIPSGSTVFAVYFHILAVVMMAFLPWMLGMAVGTCVTNWIDDDTLRMVPDRGSRKLLHLLLSAPFQITLCYVPCVILAAVIFPTNVGWFLFDSLLIFPVSFVIGYVSFVSVGVSATASSSKHAPEGSVTGGKILSVLPIVAFPAMAMYVPMVLIIFAILGPVAPSHIVVSPVLVFSIGMILTYVFYVRAANSLDSLRPRKRK
jgi:hypothetical protein